MGKGKKATVAAGKKESNGKNKENDINIMTEPAKESIEEPPPPTSPPTPLPVLIEEQDSKQKASLDIGTELQQKEQGVEASLEEKEETKRDNNDNDDEVDMSNEKGDNNNNNNTAAIVQYSIYRRMKWRSLFISILAFLLAVSNGGTLYLYNQTRLEKQALVLTAETLREGNREFSRYYKKQLLHLEKNVVQHLESQISIYQLRLQKALVAENEKDRALQEHLNRQLQTERITCEKRLEQEQKEHEQASQKVRQLSNQQQEHFDQQRAQFKKQTKQLQDEFNAVKSKLQAADDKLTLKQTELKRKEEENEKLTAFKTKATSDLEKGRKANRNLVSEIEKYKVQVETLQKRFDNLQRESNDIQKVLQQFVLDLQQCRTEKTVLVQELHNAQDQLNDLQVNLISLQDTVKSLGQDLEEEFLHLETVSETKEFILRETIATLELERQQFDATLQRTKQDLQLVRHVIDEIANERSMLERKVSVSSSPPPREEQDDSSMNNSSASSSISDGLRPDKKQEGIVDSSTTNEKESDGESGESGKVTTDPLIQQDDDKAADVKNSTVTLDGDTTMTVSQNVEKKVGELNATGEAEVEANVHHMTRDGDQGTNDAHGFKADTVGQDADAACAASTCCHETPVDEANESMDENAKVQDDQQQDNDKTLTAEDPGESASTRQSEKGKRNVVKKLQNFWSGLMKRKIVALDLALD